MTIDPMTSKPNTTIEFGDLVLPPLDPQSPTPLYHQLYLELLDQIQSGQLPRGFKIPSEAILAKKLDISRITVKRALDELAAKSLVMRRRGRGTVVTINTALPVRDGYEVMLENVAHLRVNTETDLLSRKLVHANESTAAALGVEPGANIDEIRHRLIHKRLPLSFSVSSALPQLTQRFSDKTITEEPLAVLVKQAGIDVARAEQQLSAVLADATLSDILKVKEGAPLLYLYCRLIDFDDNPVMEIITHYCPERFQYRMALLAEGEPPEPLLTPVKAPSR